MDNVNVDDADGIATDGPEDGMTAVLAKDIAAVDAAAAAAAAAEVVAPEATGIANDVMAESDALPSVCASGRTPTSGSTADALDTGARTVIVTVATGVPNSRLEPIVGAAGSSEMTDSSAAATPADGATGEEEDAAPESEVETAVGRETDVEKGASESDMNTETSRDVTSVSVEAEEARSETAGGSAADAVSSAGEEESDGASTTKSAAV
jgi:hypothetical protein